LRQVALLRGINVGRAKRVAMADLRAMMEGLGYRDVRTLLNSGNVVFTAGREAPRRAAARIEKEMVAALGVSARVLVLTGDELSTVVDENPLGAVADDPSRLLVSFLADAERRAALAPLARQSWKPEALGLGTRVAYLWCPRGILESRLLESVGRLAGDGMTSRNWSTVLKLKALL
jgi:uncharacterized protein (DUF1697 family)